MRTVRRESSLPSKDTIVDKWVIVRRMLFAFLLPQTSFPLEGHCPGSW